MKRILLTLLLVAVALTVAGTAKADVIMFPYINENQGNVATIITVINGTNCIGGSGSTCSGGSAVGALHYRYYTKKVSGLSTRAAELADAATNCTERDVCKPTSLNDIVSFDVTGQVNSAKALYGDPGAGSSGSYEKSPYSADFGDPARGDGPRRGYLLVAHATAGCTDIISEDAGFNTKAELDGEATIIDIVNGEAWGYKAALRNQYGPSYDFDDADDLLWENGYSFYENTAVWPPSLGITARYFVTPIRRGLCNYNNMAACSTNDNMTSPGKQTRIGLFGWGPNAGSLGAYGRDENWLSGGDLVQVTCVAGLSLHTLLGVDSMNQINSVMYNNGGWAVVNLRNPSAGGDADLCVPPSAYDAFVYQINFGDASAFIGAPAKGLMNDAHAIRSRDTANAPRIWNDPAPNYTDQCPPTP